LLHPAHCSKLPTKETQAQVGEITGGAASDIIAYWKSRNPKKHKERGHPAIMAAPNPKEFALRSPPADGIAALRFSPVEPALLAAASWDGSVRVYDTAANAPTAELRVSPAPVLDVAFSEDGSVVYSGGLDRTVRAHSLGASGGAATVLGGHDDAVRSVHFSAAHRLLVTGSWDRSVKLWDPRAPGGAPAGALSAPERVYGAALCGPDTLVVATAGRHVVQYDLRQRAVALSRESSLKHQTRVVRAFVDGGGFASGSVEGRVAIDFLDASPAAQAAKYAFKCHRAPIAGQENMETVYPVNAAAFHPTCVSPSFPLRPSNPVPQVWHVLHGRE